MQSMCWKDLGATQMMELCCISSRPFYMWSLSHSLSWDMVLWRWIHSLKSQGEAYLISTCLRSIIKISSFILVTLFSGFDDFLTHFYFLFIYFFALVNKRSQTYVPNSVHCWEQLSQKQAKFSKCFPKLATLSSHHQDPYRWQSQTYSPPLPLLPIILCYCRGK